MKRTSFLKLVLVFVLSASFMLTGCSSKSSDQSSATSGSETQTSEKGSSSSDTSSTAVQEDPTEIVVSFMTFGEIPRDMQLVEDAVNAVSTKEINVKVKFLPIGIGAYSEQTNLMLTSGEQLDLMSTIFFNFPAQVAKGQLLALDDLLSQYGQDIQSVLGETYIKSGFIDGATYAVTTNRDLAGGVGIVMRKDLVDKYNIDVNSIKTLDDVEAALSIIKENEPGVAPIAPAGAGQSIFQHYRTYDPLTDNLGVLDNIGQDDTLTVIEMTQSPAYLDMIDRARSWYEKGYILEDSLTAQVTGGPLLGSGKAFSYFTPTKPGIADENTKLAGTEVVVAELLPPVASTTSMQTFQWVIPNTSEYPEAAMKFLNLMYTNAEINNLLSYGVEGTNYVVLDDGQIDYPEGLDSTTNGYNLSSGWQFGNEFLTYVWEGLDPNYWSLIDTQNKNAIKSKAAGFSYMSEPVRNELVACMNVVNQYKNALESGMLDPATAIPEYRAALAEAGIDTIIAEKQKQLDAWLALQ